MIRVTELRQREVINVIDGRRLGTIKDIDLDLDNGRVKAIIVPGPTGKLFFFFGREEDLVIPWENIVKVGIDVILVESYSSTTPIHREKS